MKRQLAIIAAAGAIAAFAEPLSVSGDFMSANRTTGELTATGNVTAVMKPYSFRSPRVSRTSEGVYSFGEGAFVTTCTNATEDLHWGLKGTFTYIDEQSVLAENVWLYHWGMPIFWMPFWFQPLNTDYGLSVVPGYTSRWGGFLLSRYKYALYEDTEPGTPYLGASTRVDYRTKRGFALGQSLSWGMKEGSSESGAPIISREGLGRGKVKAYYAWDDDYDRLESRANSRYHSDYRNWGSEIERRRYTIELDHVADLTERDTFSAHVTYLSDSQVMHEFRDKDYRMESIPGNEAFYEHRELSWAGGVSVSGPVNEFFGGTSRLPEGWFAIEPQPIFDLPANYESQTRAGYLNHDYARYGAIDPMYRYQPYWGVNGRGADYQAFRMDTAHRVSIPFKLWDTLSLVPRAGYRGTYWSDSGDAKANYEAASGDGVFRHICEFGFTASARGTAWYDNWRHIVEPYLDYSCQIVSLSQGKSNRYYAFDNYDRSLDWLDQFGFEGRGLPYNWNGVRPGIRNSFEKMDDNGILRNFLDVDLYAAIPFATMTPYEKGSMLAGYPKNDKHGNYNMKGERQAVPGTRIRWNPSSDISLLARAEYDCQNQKAAYSDVIFKHRLTDNFSYDLGYIGRNHRIWSYLPSEYNRWNKELGGLFHAGFTHDINDHFAWSPFVRYDTRCNEVHEFGGWFDVLTDCIGYRIMASHETAYKRIDGSKDRADNRVTFFIYLRAFGPSSMLDLARF